MPCFFVLWKQSAKKRFARVISKFFTLERKRDRKPLVGIVAVGKGHITQGVSLEGADFDQVQIDE